MNGAEESINNFVRKVNRDSDFWKTAEVNGFTVERDDGLLYCDIKLDSERAEESVSSKVVTGLRFFRGHIAPYTLTSFLCGLSKGAGKISGVPINMRSIAALPAISLKRQGVDTEYPAILFEWYGESIGKIINGEEFNKQLTEARIGCDAFSELTRKHTGKPIFTSENSSLHVLAPIYVKFSYNFVLKKGFEKESKAQIKIECHPSVKLDDICVYLDGDKINIQPYEKNDKYVLFGREITLDSLDATPKIVIYYKEENKPIVEEIIRAERFEEPDWPGTVKKL